MNLDRLTVKLPWVDSRLMPNRKNGAHWGKSQEAKVRARQDGRIATRQALGRNTLVMPDTLAVKLTFAAPDNRHRDLDNLLAASKASLDGIAKALGVDDKRFRPLTIDAAIDSRKIGFVLVEIGI